ncbi:decarboxylating NADP(+)-dependent phosphogluconate dehydrogenase [Lentisphaera marina]|uniref:decarboxylating NADP(+)-dependent phosphogluconate dehydrogenase n=1 Tax=Lentisphaera marina TaxID=1111041 RepID=UPI0023660CB1|nr:decarboxylating NADP(+)-dependent phosphogluconate dehydrogenase [Lentisphaera marina]MDD7983424.1 decarboxylating NADP(+)-dependent phosphogluconate dehydrogenase [Lentisphaera marina]
MSQADIGLIGLAVMGQNLVMNMNDHGYTVAVYNRTTSKVDDFMNGAAKGSNVIGTHSVEEFVSQLKTPRRVMLMVKAGEVVDKFINTIVPHLEAGDIIIDGGNSLYTDSNRRVEELAAKGLRYIGAGVSGGEEGARFGPSIMPGGDPEAWPAVKNIFQDISAKVDGGEACCDWVGKGGAGHYVKMVHNGIEYGDMQLICEAYQLLKNAGFSNDEMHEIFKKWNTGVLDSFLTEITTDILGYKQEDGTHLVDSILDTAGQKGTGKWTGINALDLGMPLTLIAESVFARCVSALKDQRVEASKVLTGPNIKFTGDKEAFVNDVEQALYASKIISYAQGYMLLKEASETYKWDLDFGAIALMWRGGCIIRSVFLGNIKDAFQADPNLENLLLNDFFKDAIHTAQEGWRRTVIKGIELGVPTPCFSTALAFYDSYRSEVLPANLLQAQRDYFGAHTYERLDKPRGEFFHTNWTGKGGDVSSTTYDV